MTKKTTILLTAFFAVSGMATCHAKHKFFTDKELGQWNKRSDEGHVFKLLGIKQSNNNGWDGWDWSDETKKVFEDYKTQIKQFRDDVTYLNSNAPSLLGSKPFNLKIDGTDLDSIKNVALQIINALGNPPKADEINQLPETLSNKIEEAKDKGIDVSSMNTDKQSTSAPSHSSGGGHSVSQGRARY